MKKLKAYVKSVDNDGITVVASTGSEDRDGEKVNPAGWDLKEFQSNPVLLWSHDANKLPIGNVPKVWVEGNKLMAKTVFAEKESSFAAEVAKLVKSGFIRALSVGFMPTEQDDKGNTKKQQLLELSYVNVPANSEALTALAFKSFQEKLSKMEEDEKADKEPEPKEETKKEEAPVEKEGRVISEKNRGSMRVAIDAMDQATDSLKDLLNNTKPPEKKKGVVIPISKAKKTSRVYKALRIVDKAAEVALHELKGGEK